ncbi:ABC transporter ATP-binding protein [Candidatus Enterococcus ferrettii]|uniref:Osmoprotectant transport system ATP-binding protein n=1 Tax=Candidatus Enterococcus ferrettii TaxID=2815324 RepID=A0ABV0ESW3_9ENTE|nr:ABC transporter ATP-binding protein [Enterococcus sp. 665A]MBO1341180.1 ABC transporter ATP-binding protein [Enterococcus sp. 665A]
MESIIEFKNVGKEFEGQVVLKDLNLSVKKGEIFVLVGPSGSGKTTSLKMINGLVEPSEGDVYYKNQRIKEYNIHKLRWQIGYVLQQIALFPTMTVKENIDIIPEMLGWDKKRRNQRADELLEEVDLDPKTFRTRMPAELSGGQSQRIGILRALAAEPDVILMDEPFSALDPISRTSLQDLVLELHKKLGNTIVFVTHNMKEALKLGDRIAVMHDGKLVQCDTPEMIQSQPKDEFVKAFFDEATDELHEQTLETVYNAGYHQAVIIPEEDIPVLAITTNISQAFEAFADHEKIYIKDAQQNVIAEVTRADIFRFLS